MRKNKKIRIQELCSLIFAVGVLLLLSHPASAEVPRGGLWGSYSKNYSEFKTVAVENLDYGIADYKNILHDRTGTSITDSRAEVIWRGALFVDPDAQGEYDFHFSTNASGYLCDFVVDNKKYVSSCRNNGVDVTMNLSEGWHKVSIWYRAQGSDPEIKMYWDTPKTNGREIVPADHLGYQFWSDEVVTIPKSGKAKMDYITAGVGARDKDNPKIEINMPENVLDGETLLIWYNDDDDPDTILAINEGTNVTKSISGVRISTPYDTDLDYPETYAYLPAGFIRGDSNGKLRLSFKKLDGSNFINGLAIVVPYEDTDKPEGQLSIMMIGSTGYHGASPVMVFPISDEVNEEIQPLFLFSDGETKIVSPDKYRPNYLVMASGTNENGPPAISATLKKYPGAKMIVPEKEASWNKYDSGTWYPSYGREGQQLDVVSSNYVPNDWSVTRDQYLDSPEGKIDQQLVVPEGSTWIAFQYYGSNFDSDGVSGSGESGPISGGGLFSTIGLVGNEYDLNVIASGNGKVTSSPGGIDCGGDCYEKYDEGTTVILTATPNGTSKFLGWEGDCSGLNPVCTLVMDSEKSVKANFTVPGICGAGAGGSYCNAPINKCAVGTPTEENYDPATKTWTWKCNNGGDLSGLCSATQSCDVIESAP